jgi:hypothetical protein
MGAVREIALDLAPVAGLLVLLLGAWLGAAAVSNRSASAARHAAAAALPTGRSGDARLPGPRRGGRHRDGELTAPLDGPRARR